MLSKVSAAEEQAASPEKVEDEESVAVEASAVSVWRASTKRLRRGLVAVTAVARKARTTVEEYIAFLGHLKTGTQVGVCWRLLPR